MMEQFLNILVSILPFAIAAVVLIILIITAHVKAPPNTAYIISGLKKEPRILVGRTGFKVPLLERVDRLSLKQMVLALNSGHATSTLDYIDVQVFATLEIQINDDDESLKKAMKHFLNNMEEETMSEIQDPLQAILRELVGSLNLDSLLKNKEAFALSLQKRAATNLSKLGLDIISCVIKSVEDENGVIKALGVKKTTEIQKEATIIKVEAERDIAIETATANKISNDAKNESDSLIYEKDAQTALKQAELDKEAAIKAIERELEISEKQNALKLRQAELRSEENSKVAQADLSFEEATLEKRRDLDLKKIQIEMDKEEAELKLKEKTAQIAELVLNAEVKQVADANLYKEKQMADASLYTTKKTLEVQKMQVDTDHYIALKEIETSKSRAITKKQESDLGVYLKENEVKIMQNRAEAEFYITEKKNEIAAKKACDAAIAIESKGTSEANVIKLRSEALKNYNQAAIIDMVIGVMPEIAKNLSMNPSLNQNDPLDTMMKIQSVVENATGISLKDFDGTHETVYEEESEAE